MSNEVGTDIDVKLGERLKVLREEYDATMQEMADSFGLSKSIICLYEQGKRSMSVTFLLRVCKKFDLKYDFFLKDIL